MKFTQNGVVVEPGDRVNFDYTNWKDEGHTYVIVVESFEFGTYDASGAGKGDPQFVMHGQLVSRDGSDRPELLWGNRRRTFLCSGVRLLEPAN